MNSKNNKNSGFTLLELSMVLVIIGLISGSIFLGRELILIAQVRQQITQIEQMNLAVNTFRAKYNCLPGDCVNGPELGLGVVGGQGDNGDGDGILTLVPTLLPDVPFTQYETYDFWYHLGQAGLLSQQYPYPPLLPSGADPIIPGVHSPSLAMSGRGYNNRQGGLWVYNRIDVTYENSQGRPTASITPAWVLASDTMQLLDSAGIYKPTVTYMIDSKIDDGLPESGSMVVILGTYAFQTSCPNSVCSARVIYTSSATSPNGFASCINDSNTAQPAVYTLREEDLNLPDSPILKAGLCIPVIKANW